MSLKIIRLNQERVCKVGRRGRTVVERDGVTSLIFDLAQASDDDLVPLRQQLLYERLFCQRPAHLRHLGVEPRGRLRVPLSNIEPSQAPRIALPSHCPPQPDEQRGGICHLSGSEGQQGPLVPADPDRREGPDGLDPDSDAFDPHAQARERLPVQQRFEVPPLGHELEDGGEGVEGGCRVEELRERGGGAEGRVEEEEEGKDGGEEGWEEEGLGEECFRRRCRVGSAPLWCKGASAGERARRVDAPTNDDCSSDAFADEEETSVSHDLESHRRDAECMGSC